MVVNLINVYYAYMFCKINHLFIQFYKKLFVIVLRFAISKVVPNVFDIDENNSHDEDNTPELTYRKKSSFEQTFEVIIVYHNTVSSSIK